MSKKGIRIDRDQQALDFDTPIAEYESLRVKLLAAPEVRRRMESYEEACVEIAATVKSDIREWGGSREELVDAINEYFGASETGKKLSIHMLNHYLSKPAEYPLPAVLIFAIQHITKRLGTITLFAKEADAQVIDKDEVRKLHLGKLDDAIAEMQRLKKEFRIIKR